MRKRLAAAGAIALKNSVYLHPDQPEAREDLEWIAQEIAAGGGDAHLIVGEFLDPAATAAAIAEFQRASEVAYREVTADARTLHKKARASDPSAVTQAHDRLAQRLEQLRRQDFFGARGRTAAAQAVTALTSQLARGQKLDKQMRTSHADLKGRVWVTRPGVEVDRIASAWFIRRFVDSKARFRFEDPRAERRARDLRFDMLGGDFTHEGDRCTLETLVKRVGLPDTGVQAVAEIVHDLDLKDGKFGRPETAGVAAAIDGLVAQHDDDADRIAHGLVFFDHLRQALRRPKRGRA